MKKKFFNLAVAMSVIASSLAFSSCGDDDDEEDEPKKEQNNNNTNNDQKDEDDFNLGAATTSVKVAQGESYLVSNDKLDVALLMTVEKVSGTTVTLDVAGSEVIVGTGSADKSYAIVAKDGGVEAVSMDVAKASADQVLFICNGEATLSSGSEAKSADINSKAGKTTFQKFLD